MISRWPVHVLVLVARAALAAGPDVADPQQAPDWQPREVTRVRVDHGGAISLNGKPASLGDLKIECKRLKRNDGAVEYGRADDLGDDAATARRVAWVLVATEIPVRFVGPTGELPPELKAYLPPTP